MRSSLQKNPGRNSFPPNPKQWVPERHGLMLRQRFGRSLHVPLDPFEGAARITGVEILGRDKCIEYLGAEHTQRLFQYYRQEWSGIAIPVENKHLILVNDTESKNRQNSTLTEEIFHILLGHPPSKIYVCPESRMLRREYATEVENEAKCAAAAALVPYGPLRLLVTSGGTTESIAESFAVSVELVQWRLKVTKLWQRRN
jgi:IrrE N-terminal-like domain